MPRHLTSVLAGVCLALLAAVPVGASNDPYWDRLWGIHKVGAEQAWTTGMGEGVTIAVVDTGVDPAHEDLRDNVVAGRDFVRDDDDPKDENGHGTHVAGTAAAVANNGIGVAGVAPRAKIMPVRVLNKDGRGSLADVEDGVRWAVDHGAKVVNLSLGDNVVIENVTGGSLTDAVNYAWDRGAVAVVSAGNEGLLRLELRQARAFIVTATTPSDEQASYATDVGLAPWGIAAPGGTTQGGDQNLILSTYWSREGARYASLQGTSMAAPHVSGAAAVLLGLGLSPQETVDRLLGTARDLGQPGDDAVFGAGLVDVAAAVEGLGTAPGGSVGVSGGGAAPLEPAGGSGGAGSPGGRKGSAPAGGHEEATGAEGAETPAATSEAGDAADQALGSEEGERGGAGPLANILTGVAIASALAGAWGYQRLRRWRGGRAT